MPSTFAQARDEVMQLVNDAWTNAALTRDLILEFADTPSTTAPNTADTGDGPPAWGRVGMFHTGGGQASLSNTMGRRRWERRGFVMISLFTPQGDGLSTSDEICKIVMDALEGATTPSGVWFRHARINEVGVDGAWHQANVLADFSYDEVK